MEALTLYARRSIGQMADLFGWDADDLINEMVRWNWPSPEWELHGPPLALWTLWPMYEYALWQVIKRGHNARPLCLRVFYTLSHLDPRGMH